MVLSLKKQSTVKRVKRHVPYGKLLVPALQYWNPENNTKKATSVLCIINWIQRFGKCGAGPYRKYGKKCIRRALAMAVTSGLLKQIRGSFLLTRRFQKEQQKKNKK